MNLSAVDIAIVGAYLALTIYSGTYAKKYIKDLSGFLVAERSMGLNLGLASLISSEIGIITYMYLAEAGYRNGLAALMIGIPFFLVFLFLGRTGFIIKPLLELRIMTLPELFERKYGPGVRFLAGLLMAVGGIINFGVFPGVEAKFINTVTGLPANAILWTMIVLLAVVLLYTALGGMISVIFTNYVQYILLSLGMVFLTVFGFFKVGWPQIVSTVEKTFGARGVNPFAAGSAFGWTFFFWQLLFQLSVLTIAPYITMRIFSAKDSRTGTRIFTWSSVMFLARAVIPVFWGVLALSCLTVKPDDPLQALPLMIVQLTPKGLLGLMLAAFLAASMSTYASYLLSWSSIIAQDLVGVTYKRLSGRRLDDRRLLIVNRATMAGIIVFIIWWSFSFKSEELLFFYLLLAVNLFLAGTLISAVFGIYFHDARFGLLRGRSWGAALAFVLGAVPTVLFYLPSHPPVSRRGNWSYALALGGMVVGSVAQNIFKPVPKTGDAA
ncbi:MAG: sodium:solute symporter family protein [Candidatus Aminicenantes bacterium]|nr:sodium:solute symporter family protein [Candidatus Aminicenantes bacterium]